MSCEVVFKQHYKPRADPSTPGLNVAHLQYIATRPGAVYNRSCGFGLWGQLPGDPHILIQTDLEKAKRTVREASAQHTLYRAMLSVTGKTASTYGLYDRQRWEKLLQDHISSIAREMDIKPENFCWCASMHRERNHPHVHIIYWDNGEQPREEFIPKKRFDPKAERIRAEFSGDIHREEIRELQREQRQLTNSLRSKLQAMCLDACPEKTLSISKLYKSAALDNIADRLFHLLKTLPAQGSLRYAYLPPTFKQKVDDFTNTCLKLPELSAELQRYEAYTRKISELYSNGKETVEANVQKARGKILKSCGNEVMQILKDIQVEMDLAPPGNQTEVQALVKTAVPEIVSSLESYRTLLSLLPRNRIPRGKMPELPEYKEQLNAVLNEASSDARLRVPLQQYALNAALSLDAASVSEKQAAATGSSHSVLGTQLSAQQWEKYREIYAEAKDTLREQLTQKLRDDAGWTREEIQTAAVNMLCRFMRLLSQSASQRKAAAAQARSGRRAQSKDRSREARKDARTAQLSPAEWGDDF